MKNILFLFMMVCSSLTYAQHKPKIQQKHKEQRDSAKKATVEKLQEYRKQLFAAELGINNEKLEKFFTIYDPYLEKVNGAKRKFKKKWDGKKVEELSETEANEYLNDVLTLRENEVQWLKEVSNSLKVVLPVSKIVQLPKIEKKIKRKMLLKAKEMRGPKQIKADRIK